MGLCKMFIICVESKPLCTAFKNEDKDQLRTAPIMNGDPPKAATLKLYQRVLRLIQKNRPLFTWRCTRQAAGRRIMPRFLAEVLQHVLPVGSLAYVCSDSSEICD